MSDAAGEERSYFEEVMELLASPEAPEVRAARIVSLIDQSFHEGRGLGYQLGYDAGINRGKEITLAAMHDYVHEHKAKGGNTSE